MSTKLTKTYTAPNNDRATINTAPINTAPNTSTATINTNITAAAMNSSTAPTTGMKTALSEADEKVHDETGNEISFKKAEKLLRPPTASEIRIQKDYKYPSKAFANTTWEAVYAAVKAGYDKGQFKAYYEQREPNKPCNFHVDIDDEVESEASFDEEEYLRNVRSDFDDSGITELWKVQRSSSSKPSGKFKISFHITIPRVRFESHKHLKRWFQQRCERGARVGSDKNGRKTTRYVYYLGTTKIDMAVYCKGAWRFPLCAKEGSSRVLEYTDEPMTLQVFKELSIHYIAPTARTIEVDMPKPLQRVGMKRSHVVASAVGKVVTVEEKERFQLKGDFVYGQMRADGWQYVRATSDVWHCPFQEHRRNSQVSVRDTEVHCFACEATLSIAKKQKRGLLPIVPNIEPKDLFLGSDECYAKTMLAWYGENFLYSSKRKQYYFWNGDLWEEADDQAYYHIEDLYTKLSKMIDDELKAIEGPSEASVVDTSALLEAEKEITKCKEAKRKASEAISSLKIEQANEMADIERTIKEVQGEDYAKNKIKALKKQMSEDALAKQDSVSDISQLKTIDEEISKCEEVKRKASEAIVSLKATHSKNMKDIENEIKELGGKDYVKNKIKALKAHKILYIANAKVQKEKTKSVRDKATSALNVAIAKKKRARVEYNVNLAQAVDKYRQQKKEPEERKKALMEKKSKIFWLQNKVNKDRIVAEFFRQCKRYLAVDFFMDINDSQKKQKG